MRLALVGGGPALEQVRAFYAGTGAVFTGFMDGDELVSAIASADALVFPSTNETFGLVPLEAMACGLPAIAPLAGGLVDTLRDGVNALVYDPADPGAIADRVRRLRDDPALRERLSAGALAHARDRGWQATMDQLIDYYRVAMRVHQRAQVAAGGVRLKKRDLKLG